LHDLENLEGALGTGGMHGRVPAHLIRLGHTRPVLQTHPHGIHVAELHGRVQRPVIVRVLVGEHVQLTAAQLLALGEQVLEHAGRVVLRGQVDGKEAVVAGLTEFGLVSVGLLCILVIKTRFEISVIIY